MTTAVDVARAQVPAADNGPAVTRPRGRLTVVGVGMHERQITVEAVAATGR